MNRIATALYCLLIIAPISFAHEGDSASQILNEHSLPGAHESGLEAAIELRPTFVQSENAFYTDNEAELNYHFNSTFLMGYTQEFGTNLYEPTGTNLGMAFKLGVGFLRGGIENILKNNDTGLDYEARVYVPTDSSLWQDGQLTRIQNTIGIHHEISESLHLNLTETPIFHIYSREGNTIEEISTANKNLENRVSLAGEIFLLKKTLKIKLPLILQHVRYSDYDMNAQSNNGWGRALWIYPEITYPVTASTTIGVAYAKDLLGDISQANESMDAASDNIFQFILQQTL